MTEPPEPRRPEEGGGEEDYDATWDDVSADDLLGGIEDDALMDSIAQGLRGELGPNDLTELLSGLRDAADIAPETGQPGISTPHLDAAERGENVLPPRNEGTPTPMAISDDAAQLLAITQNGEVQGAINTAEQHLRDAVAALQQAQQTLEGQAAQAAALAGGSEGDNLNGMGQVGASAISDAMSAVAMFDGETVMGPVNAFYNAVSDSAQRHQGG